MVNERASKPIPAVTPELVPFFDGARHGELRLQRCRSCSEFRWPPREVCSHCLSRDSEWAPVSGRGTVFTFNVMHQVYHPGFASEVPYAVVLIKLDEGPKLISNLVGISPREIRIGMRVQVTFERVSDEVTLPKFTPV